MTNAADLARRRKGLLALIAFVALVLLLTAGALAGLIVGRGLEPVIEAETQHLEGLKRQRDRRRQIASTDAGETGGKDAALLLPQGSAGAAAARLQGLIVEVAERHGALVTSAQVLLPEAATETTSLERITVSIAMMVQLKGLRDFLHGLETGTPLVFVDELTVAPASPVGGTALPRLNVTVKASGFQARNARP